MDKLITTKDLMERYKVGRQAAARMMYKMPVIKIGRALFVKEKDLEDLERSKTMYPAQKVPVTRKAVKLERRRDQ